MRPRPEYRRELDLTLQTVDFDALQTAQPRGSSANDKVYRDKAARDVTVAAVNMLESAREIVFFKQVHDEALRRQGHNGSNKQRCDRQAGRAHRYDVLGVRKDER